MGLDNDPGLNSISARIPYRQILFDCDNTLVLSETIAFDVCADIINELMLSKRPSDGIRYSGKSLQTEFVGQNFAGMLKAIEKKYDFILSEEERESYINREVQKITQELGERVEPCEGVNEVLKELKEEGEYALAVVSSSAGPRVLAALRKAGQMEFFLEDRIFSAMTSLPTPTSKPDPAIYEFACNKLANDPQQCIAVEDSNSGVRSAVAAGITTIGYVGAYEEHEREAKARELTKNGACLCFSDWGQFKDSLRLVQAQRT